MCILWLLISVPINVYAARLIQQVSLDGSASVRVFPGSSITASVDVTTSGNGARSQWRSTSWRISAGSEICVEHSDYDTPGNHSESFDIIAPASADSYDLEFIAYSEDSCSGNASNPYTLTDALSVVISPEVNYRFDEDEWTGVVAEVKDSSGNDYHATSVNGPTTDISSPAIPGSSGTCSYGVFDGVDDYLALPTKYPNITDDYTITAWIRTTNNTRSGQRILIDDPNNSEGFGFSLGDGGTGRVRFFSRSTNPVMLDTANVVDSNEWYFVAAVADISNSSKTIYVYDQDGNQLDVAFGTYTNSWGYDTGDASMGGENDDSGESSSNYHFEGNIDEVIVHDGALSAAEIEAQQFTRHSCYNTSAEYRFDLCSETDVVYDDSGNGFNGVVYNGPLEISEGVVCNAAEFDGVDDYVSVDDSDLFDDTSELTIAGWIYPEDIRVSPPTGNARGIVSKRNSYTSEIAYGVFFYSAVGDGKLYVDIDTQNNRFSSNSVFPEETWTHFAVVFDGSLDESERVKVYVNGVLDTVASESSTTIPDYSSDLHLGNLYTGESILKVYKGKIDELRIMPEALDLSDIERLYTDTRSGCVNCSDSIDHYRIYHDGSGLTCRPEYLTVQVCLDSDCSITYSGEVTVTLATTPSFGSGWSLEQSFDSDNSDNAYARSTESGIVTLEVLASGDYQADDSTRCFIGTTEQPDCTMEFYDSGFTFDIPDHISAITQRVTVAAVRTDDTTEQCVPGFADVSRDLTFAYSYNNPGSGTLPVYVDDVSLDSSGTFALMFDSDGEAEIELSYADVGEMALTATYVGSGGNEDVGLVMTGTDSFITQPDHFEVTVPGNPGATSAVGGVFTKAGETFSIEVSARNASGNVTPNYGQEAVAESVQVAQNLAAPAGQHNPPLVGSFDLFGTNCAGDIARGYVCGRFSWDEVGIITVLPSVADGNYLGSGNTSGSLSGFIGRFIPDRFAVTSNTPQLGHGCGAGSYTYMGQEFSFLVDPVLTVTALGTTGSTLLNYGGEFWRYSALMADRDYSHSGTELLTVNLSTLGTITLSGAADYDGSGTIQISGDQLTYSKPLSAIAPFTAQVDLGLLSSDLLDADGICYDPENDGVCHSYILEAMTGGEQRYGQMQLQNAYGPETLPLTIQVLTEYYDGTGFILNDQDSCTSYDFNNLTLSNYQGNLIAGDTVVSGSGTLLSGAGNNLSLSAPGVGHDGSFDLEYDLDAAGFSWLKLGGNNPTASVTFGIYKGNQRMIYTRESVW